MESLNFWHNDSKGEDANHSSDITPFPTRLVVDDDMHALVSNESTRPRRVNCLLDRVYYITSRTA